ncbi:MAG: DNA polymerase III delta subunit [Candidatus Paceibacteria bacterium]|jgi:DNA polymerase III delta subunit
MLYLLHGTDTQKSLDKANKLVKTMLSKKPNASYFKISSDNFDIHELQEFTGGQGLFENKYIVQISRVLDDSGIKDVIVDYVDSIAGSDNIFIWIEGEIDKKTLSKLEKHAEKVEEHNAKEVVKKPFFNVFSLADAIGNRDKKKAWLLYNEALEELAPEEIHGTIFWQIKSILLSMKAKSASEAGLKPFVYSKSKSFSKNFEESEIEKLSSKLISVSHDARRGKHNFGMALERFILEM